MILAFLFIGLLTCFDGSKTIALDQVHKTDGKTIRGEFGQSVRQGITITHGGQTDKIPSDQIHRMSFQGDPPGLVKGRVAALDGQYEQALEELNSIQPDDLPREIIKADADFYRVLCLSKLSLAGKGDRKVAAKATLDFLSANRTTWHYYESAQLLGDLALSLGDHDNAIKYYHSLSTASTVQTQSRSVYLTGITKLSKGDFVEAKNDLQKLANMEVESMDTSKLKTLAQASLAETMAHTDSPEVGLQIIQKLISDLDILNIELAAHIYNAQGAIYEVAGDNEGAIQAYLHTDLMFSSVPEAHAKALVHLIDLWSKAGKPGRSTDARKQLKALYPGFSG